MSEDEQKQPSDDPNSMTGRRRRKPFTRMMDVSDLSDQFMYETFEMGADLSGDEQQIQPSNPHARVEAHVETDTGSGLSSLFGAEEEEENQQATTFSSLLQGTGEFKIPKKQNVPDPAPGAAPLSAPPVGFGSLVGQVGAPQVGTSHLGAPTAPQPGASGPFAGTAVPHPVEQSPPSPSLLNKQAEVAPSAAGPQMATSQSPQSHRPPTSVPQAPPAFQRIAPPGPGTPAPGRAAPTLGAPPGLPPKTGAPSSLSASSPAQVGTTPPFGAPPQARTQGVSPEVKVSSELNTTTPAPSASGAFRGLPTGAGAPPQFGAAPPSPLLSGAQLGAPPSPIPTSPKQPAAPVPTHGKAPSQFGAPPPSPMQPAVQLGALPKKSQANGPMHSEAPFGAPPSSPMQPAAQLGALPNAPQSSEPVQSEAPVFGAPPQSSQKLEDTAPAELSASVLSPFGKPGPAPAKMDQQTFPSQSGVPLKFGAPVLEDEPEVGLQTEPASLISESPFALSKIDPLVQQQAFMPPPLASVPLIQVPDLDSNSALEDIVLKAQPEEAPFGSTNDLSARHRTVRRADFTKPRMPILQQESARHVTQEIAKPKRGVMQKLKDFFNQIGKAVKNLFQD